MIPPIRQANRRVVLKGGFCLGGERSAADNRGGLPGQVVGM